MSATLKVNDTVVLRSFPKGQHYRIDRFVNPFTVKLSYQTERGEWVSGGVIDTSVLKKAKT